MAAGEQGALTGMDPFVQLHIQQHIGSYALPALLAVLAGLVGYWFLRSRGGTSRSSFQKPPASTYLDSTAGTKKSKVYSVEEVAKHNTRDDCWLIVDKKVYDVTEYVEEHPGEDAILRNAGGDSTEGFHGPQHPTRVNDHIEEYYIGDLASS